MRSERCIYTGNKTGGRGIIRSSIYRQSEHDKEFTDEERRGTQPEMNTNTGDGGIGVRGEARRQSKGLGRINN